MIEAFRRGQGDFDKLADFMEANNFSTADFLAVVCASLAKYKAKEFKTKLGVAGWQWDIRLVKEKSFDLPEVE